MIVVDVRSPKPIFEQIRDNIKQLIITGALKQDEKLPSIRELSQMTSINPNTIQKAYRELESEGFIYTVPGRGNFVAPAPKNLDPKKIEELYSILKDTVTELNFLGIPAEQILDFVRNTLLQGGLKHD
ncbi:MAG: GntR family transcriptional regulator [Clostridiaceae bacterium]|nr:GntR family transcriptional regulator [Clostridiaceae bacterium]